VRSNGTRTGLYRRDRHPDIVHRRDSGADDVMRRADVLGLVAHRRRTACELVESCGFEGDQALRRTGSFGAVAAAAGSSS